MNATTNLSSRLAAILVIGSCAFATQANATVVAIINGSSGTSESGTTTTITNNLVALHTAAGNTVTVFDSVPAAFTGFQEIWDIRFSNSGAITGSVQSQYLSLQNPRNPRNGWGAQSQVRCKASIYPSSKAAAACS
jgi:hypothetical protein